VQDNNSTSSDSVKNILDKMTAENKEAVIAEEFVFGKEPVGSGLVFDDSDDGDEVTAESSPRVTFEVPPPPPEKTVEFSVPEKFEVNKKYDTDVRVEYTPRIVTTYVPRFTDASLNYRMADEPRQSFVKLTDKKAANPATEEKYDEVDPTAEIDADVPATSGVSVNVGKSKEDELESATTVFKFVENELPREESVSDSEIEPELTEEPQEAEEPAFEEKTEEPREYKIPDPVDESRAVVGATVSTALAVKRKLEDAPEGVGDRINDGRRSSRDYSSYAQRDVFKDRFIDTIMSVRVRFLAALMVTLILAFVESTFAFGVDVPLIMNIADIPGAMALIDMQFVLSLCLLCVPESLRAYKYLLRKRLVPELFITVAFGFLCAYTAIITVHSPQKYPLFGLLLAVAVLAAIGATYYRINAEFISFKLVSKNGEKLVVDNKMTRTLEHENAALDGIVEEHKSKIARVFRTVFVSDFFKREEKNAENSRGVTAIFAVSLGVALVGGAISFFIPGGIVSAASTFLLIFMLACPTLSIILHKVPYMHAAREANLEHSAFIGEKTLYDYAGIDVMTFDDTEVFGQEDVTLQRIMLYGQSDNLTKALRQMSALFMNIGGPLDILFSDALDRKCSAAASVFVDKNGVGGEIDVHPVLAGTLEYMLEKVVRMPDGEAGARESLYDSTKVMYAAEDGEVYAKFYIRYSFSEEFSMLLPLLQDEGITPLVYTRDPNVTDELIITLTAGNDRIRVLKQTDADSADTAVYRRVSAGIVTTGDKNNAINMLLLAKRYSALQSRFAITELLAMGVGAALAFVLSISGMSLVPSIALVAWQGIWCGAIWFISRKSFRRKKRKKQ